MKEYELRYVGSHVEVYTGNGVFLFSADTVREAMEELAGEAPLNCGRVWHVCKINVKSTKRTG